MFGGSWVEVLTRRIVHIPSRMKRSYIIVLEIRHPCTINKILPPLRLLLACRQCSRSNKLLCYIFLPIESRVAELLKWPFAGCTTGIWFPVEGRYCFTATRYVHSASGRPPNLCPMVTHVKLSPVNVFSRVVLCSGCVVMG